MTRAIIITGASSGIGAATARLFLDAGWQVGLIARRKALLDVVVQGAKNAHVLPADVGDPRALETAFEQFQRSTGRLDVVFNNAGIFGPTASIDEVSLRDWQDVVNVNLHGMFHTAQLAFRQMRHQSPQGGRIINNGSLSAHSPRPGSICYTTTKHAISGLTRSLSLDGRPFGIACGQIDIGNARTEMVENLNTQLKADHADAEIPPTMDTDNAARAVFHMAGLPPDANIQTMTILATKMPFVGRG